MRNFFKIAEGVDVLPVMLALVRQPDLWNAERIRTTFSGSPHASADDILLRFEKVDGDPYATDFTQRLEAAPREWTAAWKRLPEIRPLIGPLMLRVGAYEVARVLITRLAPGKSIAPHADTQGAYANLPDIARYHLVLRGEPGSLFHCGGETVCMRTGEVWWFAADQPHAVENGSAADRIHLLIDMRLTP